MKVKLLLLISLCSAQFAVASVIEGVVRPYFYGDRMYIDQMLSTRSAKPACATRNLVRLSETDQNLPQFKNKNALLLSAFFTKTPVQLAGTGTCSEEGDEFVTGVTPL